MSAGLDQFSAQINAWMLRVGQATQQAASGMAGLALQEIVKESPQYSGDFVSGWEVSFNGPAYIWRPAKLYTQDDAPFQKGDEPAMDHALRKAAPNLARAAMAGSAQRGYGTGVSIYLSNSAKHDEPYAWKIEKGEIDFRPVNPDADHVVARAAGVVGRRYRTIGKGQLEFLRSVKV